MARKSLLLVDADPRSLRVLEVSLRKAGYNLATCGDVKTALETVEYSPPDLIVLDTRLPGPSGFELVETLRKNPDWATIPMIFLSSDTSVESKVRGLQLGVEDYLTKPIYIKEIVARINLTLARVERESVARRSSLAKTRFAGSLSDMGLVDLLQTIDISRKSGVLELRSGQRSGMVTFRDGQVLDAELGSFFGERAIYRLLLWNEGEFAIDFRPVRVEQRVQVPTQGLLMEGMRRLDEWGRLCEQIPPLQSVLEVQAEELTARLAELPDEINGILKLFDGNRSIQDVVDAVDADDLGTLSAISKLFFEGIVQPTGRVTTLRPPELGPHGDEVVPTTTASGELAAEDSERAIVDEDRMTVPGHASVAPPPMQASSPSMVPAPDHADPAASVVPGALAIPALAPPAVPSGTGMAPAMAASATAAVAQSVAEPDAPAHPPGDSSARLPKTTLIGPGFEAEQLASSAAGAGSLESPSTTSDDNEDVMSKKKRKNRGGSGEQRDRRVETEVARKEEPAKKEEAAKKVEAVSEDNVIQFPAKRSVTAVAANDDIVEAPATTTTREDDTAARRRDEKGREEKAPREEKEAREEAKPLPGEVPRVRLEDEGDEDEGLPAAIAPPPDARDRREERRRKKNATTSSGEIRALGTGEHQAAATDFFTSGKGPVIEEPDDFSDLTRAATPMAKESKQWMYGTIGIFVVFAVGIGAYWYYQNVHLPQPVELGHARRTMPSLPPPTAGSATVAPAAGSEPVGEGVEPAVEPVAEGVEPTVEPVAEVAPEGVEPVAEAVEPTVEPVAEAVEPTVEPVAEVAQVAEAVEAAPGESYDSVLAEAEAARRRPSTAIPLYERAIELNPNGTTALSQLSYLLINRSRGDDVRRAAEYAERATTLDSSDSLAWLVLGVARETLGDRVGARAAYRACVDQGAPGRWQNECRPHAR